MKLYILTSTLNFHSIMATESCSPFACYAQRGFGDSYFYLAGSFAKKNSIILFSKYPKCIMPITDEEQYSLVIEVDTDKTANFEYEKIGEYHDVVFYQTNKTIYLNPMGCRLIFETNEIRDLILSRAKVRSLDAKVLFYSKAGSFTTQFTESFTYSKEYIESYPDLEFDEENLLRDKKVNKCKGFLYAYLIGANTSPGEGVSCLQRILKDLSNLIHARIINNDFRLHIEKINELQNQFENEASKYDVVKKKFAESANRLNSSTVKMLQNELKSLGLWDALAHRMFSLPNLSSVYSFEQWNNIELMMTQFIDRISSASNNCLLVDEIPFIHEYEPPIIPLRASNQEMEIYTAWIKLLLNPKCNLKEFFANKLSYLKNLGIAAKDIMGDEIFANSPERFYYNGLIKNIRDAEDFDLSSLNSFVWQSLAICAKATNPNIDALYSLMTSCAIQDYRCAVAMWGAMCGYADLPKTFFNRIIEGVSIEEAYQYACCIEKRIHGFESAALVTQISQLPKETDILLTEPFEYNPLEDIIHKYLAEYEKEKGKKLPKSHLDSIEKALSCTHDGTVLSFLMKLNDFSGFTKKTKTSFWTYLKDKTCPEYDEITTAKTKKKSAKNKQESLGLFDKIIDENKVISQSVIGERNLKPINPTSSKFVEDANVNYFILSRNYLPIKMRETLSKKVITFQKGYAPGGRYHSRPLDNPVDNRSTIDHFKHWCFYKGDYPPIVEGTPENKQYFEQLTQDLFDRYGNR